MTSRKAFEEWIDNRQETYQVHEGSAWEAWQAACGWQQNKDINICLKEEYGLRLEKEYDSAEGANICAEAISNQ